MVAGFLIGGRFEIYFDRVANAGLFSLDECRGMLRFFTMRFEGSETLVQRTEDRA